MKNILNLTVRIRLTDRHGSISELDEVLNYEWVYNKVTSSIINKGTNSHYSFAILPSFTLISKDL